MTNREKFAEQILDVACSGNSLAMDKEKNITSCGSIDCDECEFSRKDTGWCGKNIKKWANSEYIEKPEISESDRRFLDCLSKDYKWMARDENNRLYVFRGNKPSKCNYRWIHEETKNICLNVMFEVTFPMVKWEDSEPWLIEDLKNLEVEK